MHTRFFIRKKVIRKWGSNRQNLKKIVRKSRGSNNNIKCFHRPKIGNFDRYCIQNVKDGIQIQVYNSINESINHSSQFISAKVRKNLRKSQAQFREKLRKLRLRQSNDFLITKYVYVNLRTDLWPLRPKSNVALFIRRLRVATMLKDALGCHKVSESVFRS